LEALAALSAVRNNQELMELPMLESRYLTVRKFAKELDYSIPFTRKLIYKRLIACVRVGRAIRIPAEELERLVKENTVPAR
jgi:excisionase family DNA binding protein